MIRVGRNRSPIRLSATEHLGGQLISFFKYQLMNKTTYSQLKFIRTVHIIVLIIIFFATNLIIHKTGQSILKLTKHFEMICRYGGSIQKCTKTKHFFRNNLIFKSTLKESLSNKTYGTLLDVKPLSTLYLNENF